MHRRLLLDELIQDLRIGLRGLLRARLLTLTIVATVGLGIGATTVIFGAVNATLLRPLPYADPDRLVRIYTDAPPNKFPFSVADYQALEAQQTRVRAHRRIPEPRDGVQRRQGGRASDRDGSCPGPTSVCSASRRRSAATSPNRTAGPGVRGRSSSVRASGSSGSADAPTRSASP